MVFFRYYVAMVLCGLISTFDLVLASAFFNSHGKSGVLELSGALPVSERGRMSDAQSFLPAPIKGDQNKEKTGASEHNKRPCQKRLLQQDAKDSVQQSQSSSAPIKGDQNKEQKGVSEHNKRPCQKRLLPQDAKDSVQQSQSSSAPMETTTLSESEVRWFMDRYKESRKRLLAFAHPANMNPQVGAAPIDKVFELNPQFKLDFKSNVFSQKLTKFHKVIADSKVKNISLDEANRKITHYCYSKFDSLSTQDKILLFKNILLFEKKEVGPLMGYFFINSLFVPVKKSSCEDFFTDGSDYNKAPLAIAYNGVYGDNYYLVTWIISFYAQMNGKGICCGDPAMVKVNDAWTILEDAMINNKTELVKYLLDYPRLDHMEHEIIKTVRHIKPFCNLSEGMKALLNRYAFLSC